MIITDLVKQFNATTSFSEEFIALMHKSFKFYAEICDDFFLNLPERSQNNTFNDYLRSYLTKKLFSPEFCENLENTKKEFLKTIIKLEEFQDFTDYKIDFINNLNNLKQLADEVYQLLEHHWELFKYNNGVIQNKILIDFILEIDAISQRWNNYLTDYSAAARILNIAGKEPQRSGFKALLVKYYLPENETITLNTLAQMILFLQLAYDFIIWVNEKQTVQNQEEKQIQFENLENNLSSSPLPSQEDNSSHQLEIYNVTMINPVACTLFVPEQYAETYTRFLHYLSVDVIKKETLLKFVMEVLRLQFGKSLSKQAVTTFQKKISKQLNLLHPEGYFSINQETDENDSIKILKDLCHEMDQLKIQYKDLLTGSTERLVKNRLRMNHQIKKDQSSAPENKNAVFSDKIDIAKKEHIRFLTS